MVGLAAEAVVVARMMEAVTRKIEKGQTGYSVWPSHLQLQRIYRRRPLSKLT